MIVYWKNLSEMERAKFKFLFEELQVIGRERNKKNKKTPRKNKPISKKTKG